MGGVLKSWAVPRGPSLDPKVKRMAVFVEDHPVSSTEFEGNIPKGQYGGGAMVIWDHGTWVPMGDPLAGLEKGEIKFRLAGKKLKGGWALVRLKAKPGAKVDGWFLQKDCDIFVQPEADGDITEDAGDSVATGRSIEEIVEAARAKIRRRKKKKVSAAAIAGASPGGMPDVPRPQFATRTGRPRPTRVFLSFYLAEGSARGREAATLGL
jgi:bifunctional non-homologous end joining protein LigD